MPKIVFLAFLMLYSFAGPASVRGNQPSEDYGQYIPPPQYLGMVRLNNFTKQADIAPVIFDHWLHRAIFTCRICHVDIGFAMKARGTAIRAEDNINGYFCGSCHDGKQVINGEKVFASCATKYTKKEGKRCVRCHSEGKEDQRKYNFQTFTKDLPQLQYNQIDWEKAEELGKIKSIDSIEGLFYKTETIAAQRNFSIKSKSWRKADVIFSHKKHVAWNGCAICHPLIFPSSKKGTIEYTMFSIMEGEYCGACHVNVAFSVWLCYKCHRESTQ